MAIGGLQKNSLIDYPGKVSCVVFVSGCNFTCPYCHNPDLATGDPRRIIDLETVLDFIDDRRGFLDGVVISGGEPTLWPGLHDLCGRIQSLGLKVKLDTNGSCPDVLTRLIDAGRVDYLAMDLKSTPDMYRPPLCRFQAWSAVAQSIACIMESGVDYEFRTTCVKPFVDKERIATMAGLIKGARRYALQTFRPETLLDPDFRQKAYTAKALGQLQAIAADHVTSCIVR